MRSLTLVWIALGGSAFWAACGSEVNVINPTPTTTSGTSATGGTGTGGGGTSTSTGVGASTSTGGQGGSPQPVEVPCGQETCVNGEVCCVPFMGGEEHCESVAVGCDDMEIQLGCDGSSDCPGDEICCIRVDFSGGFPPDVSPSECTDVCEGQGALTMCEGQDDCEDDVPCTEIPMIGLMVCQNFGPPPPGG